MTCEKVAINGPNLKKLAHKKNQTGESGDERKQNPSANPGQMRSFESSENIHKKDGESYYVVSANKASSMTL